MNKFMSYNSSDMLSRYMRDVRKYPVLSAEVEADLARRWRDHRDPEAAEMLVGSHQRLVVKIAGDYRRYGLPIVDLISEGNVGLMQAVEKFDVDRGFRLSTYAMWWIRAAISDYVVRSSSLVRFVTNEHRRKLFFNLGRLRSKHQPGSTAALTPENVTAIADALGVPEDEVVLMDRHLAERDASVNSTIATESDSGSSWQDFLADDAADQESQVIDADEHGKRRLLMENALAQLDERERHILVERKLKDNPPRLSDLSAEYGVSRERVRQIEARAFAKLKRLMLEAARAGGLAGPRSGPATAGAH